MRCTFCATGKGGFARNLLPHEIVDQVLTVQEAFGQVTRACGSVPSSRGTAGLSFVGVGGRPASHLTTGAAAVNARPGSARATWCSWACKAAPPAS